MGIPRAATGGLVLVDGVGEQAVGTIKAHGATGHAGRGSPIVRRINREVRGPTVVGAPRQFAALKQ